MCAAHPADRSHERFNWTIIQTKETPVASPDTDTADAQPEVSSVTEHVTTMDAQSAAALAHEMADVAAAMFGLLLLQSPARPVHQDISRAAVSEPLTHQAEAQVAAVPSPVVADQSVSTQSLPVNGPAPVGTPTQPAMRSVSVSSIPMPALTAVPSAPTPSSASPAPIAVPAGALPVAIPVPVLVGEPAAEETLSADTSGEEQRPTDETPSAPAPIAAVAPVAPRTMAMLNEIAFLDD
jgi:hypothetical protein